jgi:hypothetical protein
MSEWPKTVRSGSVTVKIYQHNRGDYRQHIVTYYLGKQRVRKVVTDFASAKKEAERVANRLSHGETQALKLTSEDFLWRILRASCLNYHFPKSPLHSKSRRFVLIFSTAHT